MNARLWKKLSKYAADVGYEMVKMVLELYYTSKAKGTPIPIKTAILGALAYFIMPLDAIPDLAPAGYVDDGGVLTGALATARAYMTVETARQAKNKLSQLFGSSDSDKSGGISRAGSSGMSKAETTPAEANQKSPSPRRKTTSSKKPYYQIVEEHLEKKAEQKKEGIQSAAKPKANGT